MSEIKAETTIGKSMRAADDREKCDAACKKILSEKIILAWIMHSCVEEFRKTDVNEIANRYIEGTPQVSEVPVEADEENPSVISGLNTEDSTISEGTIYYDIRFYALVPETDERIRLIMNVEAQGDFYPGYPIIKRGIYYCSRLISAQYGTEFTGSHYEKIRKVYSIWICMVPPQMRQNSINRYALAEEKLIGSFNERKGNYDLMTVVMICLGEPENAQEGGLLRLLDVLFSSEVKLKEKQRILEDEYEIPMSKTIEKEVSEMSHYLDGVYEKGVIKGKEQGIEQGIERGIEQGIEQGIERGIEQGIEQGIQSLMDTMTWTAEQAMAALKVPEEDWPKYEEKIRSVNILA